MRRFALAENCNDDIRPVGAKRCVVEASGKKLLNKLPQDHLIVV